MINLPTFSWYLESNILNCPEYFSYHASLLATFFLSESIGAGGRSTPIVFHIIRDKLINPVVGVYIPTFA